MGGCILAAAVLGSGGLHAEEAGSLSEMVKKGEVKLDEVYKSLQRQEVTA